MGKYVPEIVLDYTGMNNKKLGAWAASSSNPEEVSTRIKGLVVAGSAIIIFLGAQFFNIQLSGEDVVAIGTQLGMVGGAIWSVYGAGLWLVRFVASKKV